MAGSENLGKVGMTTGGEYSSSATYKKLTIVKHNGSQWISKTDVPSGNAPSADSTYWQLMHGTTDLKVLMTGDTASLDPNKVYVWEEAVTNLTITALNGGKEGRRNRYVFQFKNPKSAYTVLTLPSGVLWSSDTELDDNGVPVLDRDGCTRVEIVDNLATAKRWPSIYIIFEDPDVEAVLMSKGVSSDGIGITRKDARKVSTIGGFFTGNTTIRLFQELKFFTSIKEAPYQSFKGCTALEKIDLRKLLSIGAQAFHNCAKLAQDIELPLCTSFGNDAFNGCSAITKLFAPKAQSLGNSVCHNCTSLTQADLSSATAIGYASFKGCANLEEVVTSDALVTVGAQVFQSCAKLKGHINVENVTSLGNTAFVGCTSLNQDMHFKSLTGTVAGAFGTSGVRSLAFPVATNCSAYQHFMNCPNLKYVLYGNTVTSIGTAQVFNGCTSLEAIIILNTEAPTLYSAATLARPTNCPIYVPDASVELYKGATNYNGYAAYIKGISDLQTDNPELYAEIQDYL